MTSDRYTYLSGAVLFLFIVAVYLYFWKPDTTLVDQIKTSTPVKVLPQNTGTIPTNTNFGSYLSNTN